MNGVILVHKPHGFTSFDVVAKLKGVLSTKKLGHGGTLDPMATGVLPIFVGSATKAADLDPDDTKVYKAKMLLGVRTSTADTEGEVLEKRAVDGVDEQRLQSVFALFLGTQAQVPPMYSAVKINGTPLYKLARKGVEVERKARNITIFSIGLLGGAGEHEFEILVHCTKGTYIRTLIEDIGNALGCGACMSGLLRTKSGSFEIANCVTIEQLQQLKNSGAGFESALLPLEQLFINLPFADINGEQLLRFKNGASVPLADICVKAAHNLRPEQYSQYLNKLADLGHKPMDGVLAVHCDGAFCGLIAQREQVYEVYKLF